VDEVICGGKKVTPGKLFLLAFVAGIMEFVVVGILFLMAGFAFAGYLTFSRFAATNYARDPVERAQLVLGIAAFLGFVIGLAGSVSAIERKRWFLSIIGALTTAFWGVLLCFYTLLAITDPDTAAISLTIGYTVILLSVFSGALLIVSRHEFQQQIS
jgi:hypothetical protein